MVTFNNVVLFIFFDRQDDFASAAAKPSSTPSRKSFVAAALRAPSFKVDTYFASELKHSEKKALSDLKIGLASLAPAASMWGIPLLSGDDRADVILLKFLRARDFNVPHALHMLAKCLAWRKEFGADEVAEEELAGFEELQGVVAYMNGFDRFFGGDGEEDGEEKLKRFLRWRVQVLERGIKLLHFKPGGVNSLVQVTDLKDMPKRELRVASNHILSLFQDNYPELVARKYGVLNVQSIHEAEDEEQVPIWVHNGYQFCVSRIENGGGAGNHQTLGMKRRVLFAYMSLFAGSVVALGVIVSAKPLDDLGYKGLTVDQNVVTSPYASSVYLGWAVASAIALLASGLLPIISWFVTYRFPLSSGISVGIFAAVLVAFCSVSYLKVVSLRVDQVPMKEDFLAALLPLLCIFAVLSLSSGLFKWKDDN
ncbi:unnamed protein product [Cuscuta campestris]|uniref:CRAL/TRIO N-terminal domain-containing protein n=1 Tax=Cuscuta campestris TaxID=132261 RepID=A0A484NAG3_9ASTE|nr:unnamed protein product [Cuscuta campestris]